MSACDCGKCPHYEADGAAAAPPTDKSAVQVHVSSSGIGDHMTALCAAAGLKLDGNRVVFAGHWQALPWVELFAGYDALRPDPAEGVETFQPWEYAWQHERTNRRRPRWEWYAEACGTTPAIPDLKPLPAQDVFQAQRYRGHVALAPWANWPDREWPLDYWIELERMLIEGGVKCVVLGASKNNNYRFKSPAFLGARPAFVAALLRSCRMLIGNDSGLCHVAGMIHAPALALCGPTNGKAVFPYPAVNVLQAKDNHLPNLTPADVANEVLGRRPPSPWPVVKNAGKTRHLLYHLYPCNKDGGATWRWNVAQLRRRLPLFNGRRIVSVATDGDSDSAKEVRKALGGVEFVEIVNSPRLREVASFQSLFGRLAGTVGPEDAIFFGHGKAVTNEPKELLKHWAEVLYETNLDHWPLVRDLLRTCPAVGSLKRVGSYWPESFSSWHYSGSFYWIRGDVLQLPDWRRIDYFWSGIEPWPSLHVTGCYAGTVFHSDSEAPAIHYRQSYWNDVLDPEYVAWRLARRSRG